MLDIKKLLETQAAFNQGRFIDYATATDAQRMALSKDLVLHLLHEVHEVLDHLDWKMHKKPGGGIDKFAAAEELVDVLKFWAAIPTLWDISPEMLTEIHAKKSQIVEGRYEVEQRMPATGPELWVSLSVLWNETDAITKLVDKFDMTLVVDMEDAELTSEAAFEFEYQIVGRRRFKHRKVRGVDYRDDIDRIGIIAAEGTLFTVLPWNQPPDGYPGRTNVGTIDRAVSLVNNYLEHIMKEVIS